MDKEKLQHSYEILKKLHYDFSIAYPNYNSGKNKAIRESAGKDVEYAISLTKIHIERNPEVYSLFAESEFSRPFAYDEFYQPNYFGGDMSKFLKIIKDKLESEDF